MPHAAPVTEPRPLAEMNTTPLIDVMLVLLIMFIITIPIQSHAVKLDLPTCAKCPKPDATKNEIRITRGDVILWNETPLSQAELRYELTATRRMLPEPELHLRPDGDARYEIVDKVLAIIKQADVKKVGFVGNETYRF